jgi:glycosyltransferase involved in cell wall biosynthesis
MNELAIGDHGLSVAVLIPCHNESAAIAAVVQGFREHLPRAAIYVYDNASTDDTAEVARRAGAIVRSEPLKGKGNVVRRMFADVEADAYILVDGDDTYDAASAPRMVAHLVEHGLDMVNCARVATRESAFRPGHVFGNRMLTGLVARIFGNRLTDMLSGYRALSRRLVKSLPLLSTGFEIETELTVHALELRLPVAELTAPYRDRPVGSASKLRTLRDGTRILQLIVHLVKEERPLQFFSLVSAGFLVAALALGWPVVSDYFATGQVLRLPTAVLATGLSIISVLSLFAGLMLDTVTRGRRELKRMFYLAAGQGSSRGPLAHAGGDDTAADVRPPAVSRIR